MNISASLVLYNTDKDLIEESISSFLNSKLSGDLWIIDNSEDNKYSYLDSTNIRINYISSKENYGYGRAHNIALKHFLDKSTFHLVLNPDISFKDDTIEELVEFLSSNDRAALVAPKAEYPNGEKQSNGRLIPSPLHLFLRRFFVLGNMKRKFNKEYELDFNQKEAYISPVILGSFMLFKMKCLRDVGLFDERFFLYPEDIDLSRRLFEKYDNYIYPKIKFIHHHKQESYSSFSTLLIHIKEMIKYFNKWSWLFDSKRKSLNNRALAFGYKNSL